METLYRSANLMIILHPNKIYEFIYISTKKEAVNEYYQQLKVIIDALSETEGFSQIVDISVGIVPVTYAMKLGRDFAKMYPIHHQGRTVILYKDYQLVSVLDAFLRLLDIPTYRMFTITKREQALQWLNQAS